MGRRPYRPRASFDAAGINSQLGCIDCDGGNRALLREGPEVFSSRVIWHVPHGLFGANSLAPALGPNIYFLVLVLKACHERDSINATPLTGQGAWSLDLHHHKIVTFLLFALLINCLFNVTARKFRADPGKRPAKLFLTTFASMNFMLILLVLTNALGQATFWLPPVVCGAMCWIEWEPHRKRRVKAFALFLTALCLLLLSLEEVEQAAVVALTWNQRSTVALTDFVRRTIPPGAVVYGPVGGYFYPVELSGGEYLYPYERTTPGLYSKTDESIGTSSMKGFARTAAMRFGRSRVRRSTPKRNGCLTLFENV